jgi:hypothetical protein
MKIELFIILITGFLIANTYYDNKLIEKIKSWKKFYKMIFYGFVGLCIFLIIKKTPNKSYELLNHANQFIKFMPIDKNAKDLFEPFIDFTKNNFKNNFTNNPNSYNSTNNYYNYNQSGGEKRILNSGKKSTKRSVSETKKKFVASQQNWCCKKCQIQLPAWFEVDHVIKLEYGGSNSIENLEALCRDCHGRKTAMENL